MRIDADRLSVYPARSSFVARELKVRQQRLTLHPTVAMCPPVRATGILRCLPGKELNIAQHARRQAALKLLRLRAFSVEQSNRGDFPHRKVKRLHAND
jgi:hypothetical protein